MKNNIIYVSNKENITTSKVINNCHVSDLLEEIKTYNHSYNIYSVKIDAYDATDMHSHHFSDEIYYIISGKCTVETDSNLYNINQNDLVLIPKAVSHRIRNENQEELIFLVIRFSKSAFDDCNILL